MARKKRTYSEPAADDAGKGKARARQKKLLLRIRERYPVMVEADQENRRCAMEDFKFIHRPGEQWDPIVRRERGDRPCYEFNKLRIKVKRIVNDMRANRPQGKVRAAEDSDKDKADIYEGLCRNVWNVSDGDTICDYAGEYQVGAGMGAWRIDTDYASEDVFEQDILVKPVKNPFTLYWDPAASDPLKRDAADWINTERISNAAYDQRWPKAQRVSFTDDTEFDDDDGDWTDEETVRIVEYWYKEPYTKELLQLKDGMVIDAATDEGALVLKTPDAIRRRRTVKCERIKMCIASGDAILEESDWAGSIFPFVVVHGEWVVIDGKVSWFGLPRHAKDAQRSYNVARTSVTETIALAPNSPYWATAKQAEGHLREWAEAHKQLRPVQLYNADPAAQNPPARMGGADVPVALIQELTLADQELKDVTGVYDPALGAKSNETSGRAITRRTEQSELVNFNFQDNMSKGIRLTWEILVDLIPHIYDTERSIRILGVDGAEKFERINVVQMDPATGQPVTFNDVTEGKYDVTVTTGPSFTTQRQEAGEMYMQLGRAFPPVMQIAGDLIFKSMDLPYANEIAERLRTMLPPQIQQMLQEGKKVPPEAQAVMAQAAQAMQVVQQQTQLIQQAAQEVEQSKAESDKAKAEVQTAIEKLKTEEARFDAQVAKALAGIAQKEAQLAIKAAQSQAQDGQQAVEQDRQSLVAEANNAVQTIQQAAQQMMGVAAQVMAQIDARASQPQAPRRRQLRAKRVNGELVGTMDELDESGAVVASREARVRRENGELVGEA